MAKKKKKGEKEDGVVMMGRGHGMRKKVLAAEFSNSVSTTLSDSINSRIIDIHHIVFLHVIDCSQYGYHCCKNPH